MEKFEELLVQAWKEVFGLETVEYDANFFELGGDSIKAVQLAAWLLQKGIKLNMMDIFTSPTIDEQIPLLEETAPMYIPPSVINKEMAKEMNGTPAQQAAAPSPQPVMGTQVPPQQICTPQQQSMYAPQQMCTPQQSMYAPQQMCTPQQSMYAPQQMCTPQQNMCTPQQNMYAPQSLCSPMVEQQLGMYLQQIEMYLQQLCTPQGMQMLNNAVAQLCTPQAGGQQLCTGTPAQGDAGRRPVGAVEKPIENPSIVAIQKPKVGKPTVAPDVALDIVIKGIINRPYGRDDNFFKIGMNDFSVMQIVTRCAEQGYRVQMKDIAGNPTFNGLVGKLVAGE